jgi:hypothetical protein
MLYTNPKKIEVGTRYNPTKIVINDFSIFWGSIFRYRWGNINQLKK